MIYFRGRAVTASELFGIVKDKSLLLDLWGGRNTLAAAQRFGRVLTNRRDRVFGNFELLSAGKDAVANSNAYRLEGGTIRTPETRQGPSDLAKTPSATAADFTGFLRVSRLNPEKPSISLAMI